MQERDVTREDSLSSMKSMWQAMKEAASSYDPSLKSASGLSGDRALMTAYMEQGILCADHSLIPSSERHFRWGIECLYETDCGRPDCGSLRSASGQS